MIMLDHPSSMSVFGVERSVSGSRVSSPAVEHSTYNKKKTTTKEVVTGEKMFRGMKISDMVA